MVCLVVPPVHLSDCAENFLSSKDCAKDALVGPNQEKCRRIRYLQQPRERADNSRWVLSSVIGLGGEVSHPMDLELQSFANQVPAQANAVRVLHLVQHLEQWDGSDSMLFTSPELYPSSISYSYMA
jgi:hypothetical protein